MLPGAVHPSRSSASVRCGTATCTACSPSHSWPESSPCFASFSSRYFSASWTVRSTFGCCFNFLSYAVVVVVLCTGGAPSASASFCLLPRLPLVRRLLFLCLLLAMLFFACCWLCSSLPAVGYALVMPAVGFALSVMGPWVPTLAVFFMGSRVPIPGCLFMGSLLPARIIRTCFLGSVVQVTVVLRHRAVLVLVACTPQARSTI